jgi:hypothetical protein
MLINHCLSSPNDKYASLPLLCLCPIADTSSSSSHHILIGQGNYHEVLNISRSGPLALLVRPPLHSRFSARLTLVAGNDRMARQVGEESSLRLELVVYQSIDTGDE